MFRAFVGAVLLFAVAACDRPSKLYSEEKLFAYRDPSAVLKPGLWLVENPACPVDIREPTHQWPECRETVNIGDGWTGDLILRYPFVVVAGEPRILQIEYASDYVGYDFLTSLQHDPQGRVIAAYRELMNCAFEAPPSEGYSTSVAVPGAPCPVKDAETVRRVAADSAPKEPRAPNFRWVREKHD